MKTYSKQDTITEVQGKIANGIDKLYQADCVNWKGTTSQGKYYSEIIAEELLYHIKDLKSINAITRSSSYKTDTHDQLTIDLKQSNRLEDIFAKRIYGLEFNELGKIIDYQTPMRDTAKDKGLKAFDLLSYKEDENCLYMIELKYLGSTETLLRSILECYTYFRIVDHTKLISDFNDHIKNPASTTVKPVVLLVSSESNPCNPYDECMELETVERSMLKALSLALGIKLVLCDLPDIFYPY